MYCVIAVKNGTMKNLKMCMESSFSVTVLLELTCILHYFACLSTTFHDYCGYKVSPKIKMQLYH